ncbi:NAD(P)/FAD-dependent oxidoreductase [Nocardia aurantiaca]|uniref:Oxidoreductase n=1 Tax=Nocardia aurantiaca TaxID=2675850 RepID=A0A6I3L327_9NOCA|nr:FAD-dependent oxidoreductase [Nocardia aurantiaca]MTE14936.1 oxidoreductase [Nocardia aurantiaca]
MTTEHRIVVLGAGYAGLSAARRAAKIKGVRVTVVDARAEFVDRVRLHQALAGQQVPRADLGEVLAGKGIEFVQARVERIDTAAHRIRLADGGTRCYDTLVYALGSSGDRSAVPGATEFAYSVAVPEDIGRMPALSGRIAVVGGGATGIEVASELAESRPDLPVSLISADEPGGWLSAKAHNHIRAVLDRLGVRVRADVKVAAVTADGLELVDGERVPAETVLWTTGFGVPRVAADSGLAVDPRGRVLVDDELRSRSHPDIYAVGDAAVIAGPDGRDLRMACATAIPAGTYAATAIAARLRGKEPAAREYRYVFQCISLGRRDGVIQFVHADDSNARTVLTGRTAAWFKEQIVRMVGKVAQE